MKAAIFCLIASTINLSLAAKKIPDYVLICKRDDPKIGECYANSLNIIVKHLGNGLPEMNLRKVDPLLVEKISLDQGSATSLGFKADLTNLMLFGLSKLKAEKVDIDMKKLLFKVDLKVPNLFMLAKFNAKGRVLLFQFDSDGEFTGNLTGVHIFGTWKGVEYVKKGKIHVEFELPDLNLEIEDIKMHFDNLLPNKEVNDRTNEVINENIDVLYDEMKPVLVETVKSIIIDSVNNVFKLFPLDVLFPK